jgi:hypothetical protein
MLIIAARIYQMIKRNALLGIYPIFILVQCFCYSQYSPDFPIGSTPLITLSKDSGPSKGLLSKGQPRTNKCQFRLNKRFHPETVPVLVYAGEEIPVCYLDVVKTLQPKAYILIADLLASLLRGPPTSLVS